MNKLAKGPNVLPISSPRLSMRNPFVHTTQGTMKTVGPGKPNGIHLTEAVKKWSADDDAAMRELDAEIFDVMLRHVMAVSNRFDRRHRDEQPGVSCTCGFWCRMKPGERCGTAHMHHVAERIAARIRELD